MIQRYLFPLFEEDLNDYQVQCTNKSKNSTVSGLGYCSKAIYSGKYGIPKIKAYYDVIPDKFITYSESSKFNEYSCGVSSFDDDFILIEFGEMQASIFPYSQNSNVFANRISLLNWDIL